MSDAKSELLDRLAMLVKKNKSAYRAAIRDFRKEFTLKSQEQEEKV